MTEIDPKFTKLAEAIVDRLTPGMVEREPETIAAWVALALQEQIVVERQRWVDDFWKLTRLIDLQIVEQSEDGFSEQESVEMQGLLRLSIALRERLEKEGAQR